MFDDLYPVAVQVGERRYPKARAVHRDGQVKLLADTGREVEVVAAGTVIDYDRRPGRRWVLMVDDGDAAGTWDVRRASGCGCGSRLKRYDTAKVWA